MRITALSSLSLLARDSALNAAYLGLKKQADDNVLAVSLEVIEPPHDAPTGPDPDFPEAGENPSRIFFKLSTHGADGEYHQTLCVIGDCVSCATNAVLPDVLEKVEDAERLVLALPVGVSLNGIIALVAHNQDECDLHLESAAFAALASNIEEDLWSSRTLYGLGVTGSCLDERTPGEFIIKELALADTVITAEHPFEVLDAEDAQQVRELVHHLAPHAEIADAVIVAEHAAICGCHSLEATHRRAEPGYLNVPAAPRGENFSTVVLRTDRLLDAQVLGRKLRHIVKDAYRVRGYFWMTGYEQEAVALEGVGPQTWLQSCGSWGQVEPHTAIAITGRNLDGNALQKILDSCALSGDQLVEKLLKTAG